MLKLTRKLYRQFMRNVKITKGKCWLWKGGKTGEYGGFYIDGIQYRAHRLAVTLFLDPNYLPVGRGIDGDYVTHDCDTPLCVSPHCIRIGDNSVNQLESFDRNKERALAISKRMIGNKYGIGNSNALGIRRSSETRKKLSESTRLAWERRHAGK